MYLSLKTNLTAGTRGLSLGLLHLQSMILWIFFVFVFVSFYFYFYSPVLGAGGWKRKHTNKQKPVAHSHTARHTDTETVLPTYLPTTQAL